MPTHRVWLCAAQTVVKAHRWRTTRMTVTRLEQALVTRAEIGQA
ncbi:hypothetical protein [Nocardia uniformis]|nr:hypothetical protein [Nocardia uniformis]